MAVPRTLPFLALLGLSLLVSCASSRRLAKYELSGPSGSIASTVSLTDPVSEATAKKVSREVVLINTPSGLAEGAQNLEFSGDGGTYEQKLVLANVASEFPPVFQEIVDNGSGSKFSQSATQIGTEDSFSSQSVLNDASNTDNSQSQLIVGSTNTDVVQSIVNNPPDGDGAVNIQDATSIDDTNQVIVQQLINGVPAPPSP